MCACMSAARRSTTSPISATPAPSSPSTCSTGCCAMNTAPSTCAMCATSPMSKTRSSRRPATNGEPIDALTRRTTAIFHEDMAALGNLPPDVEPRATEYIPQMIRMIERLIASGHAYAAEGHALFRVASYARYGALSRRSRADHDRRRPGRDRALQGRPRRFRAVEAVNARPAWLGQPVGPRPAGLAHRMLGDERRAARATPSTSTAAGSTSSSRTTRTRSRRACAPMTATPSRAIGCTTGC